MVHTKFYPAMAGFFNAERRWIKMEIEKKTNGLIKLELGEDGIGVRFDHKHQVTPAEENLSRDYFVGRFSGRVGSTVPTGEVVVSPKAGEIVIAQTHFMIGRSDRLYPGLIEVAKEDPESLSKLIKDLGVYQLQPGLSRKHQELLTFGVAELNRIIELGDKYQEQYIDY